MKRIAHDVDVLGTALGPHDLARVAYPRVVVVELVAHEPRVAGVPHVYGLVVKVGELVVEVQPQARHRDLYSVLATTAHRVALEQQVIRALLDLHADHVAAVQHQALPVLVGSTHAQHRGLIARDLQVTPATVQHGRLPRISTDPDGPGGSPRCRLRGGLLCQRVGSRTQLQRVTGGKRISRHRGQGRPRAAVATGRTVGSQPVFAVGGTGLGRHHVAGDAGYGQLPHVLEHHRVIGATRVIVAVVEEVAIAGEVGRVAEHATGLAMHAFGQAGAGVTGRRAAAGKRGREVKARATFCDPGGELGYRPGGLTARSLQRRYTAFQLPAGCHAAVLQSALAAAVVILPRSAQRLARELEQVALATVAGGGG